MTTTECNKSILSRLISYNHTGFNKNRFIRENIQLIDKVIQYTAVKNIPRLLLSFPLRFLKRAPTNTFYSTTRKGFIRPWSKWSWYIEWWLKSKQAGICEIVLNAQITTRPERRHPAGQQKYFQSFSQLLQ